MTNSTTTYIAPAVRKSYPTAVSAEVHEVYTANGGWAAGSGELTAKRATLLGLQKDAVALRITLADGTTVVADFRAMEIAPTAREMRAVLAGINILALASLSQSTGSELVREVAREVYGKAV